MAGSSNPCAAMAAWGRGCVWRSPPAATAAPWYCSTPCGQTTVVEATVVPILWRYLGPPEKVNSGSASTKKGDLLEPAARSLRRSYLRLQWHSATTTIAFFDQEKA